MDKILARDLNQSRVSLKMNITIIASLLLTLAASGPQIGTRVRHIERKGVDLVIALDTSTSMDAEDVTPSRLEKSKLEIGKLIRNLKGDRVAVIVLLELVIYICLLLLTMRLHFYFLMKLTAR